MINIQVGDEVIVVGSCPEWGGPIFRVERINGQIIFTPIGHGDYAGLPGVVGPAGQCGEYDDIRHFEQE